LSGTDYFPGVPRTFPTGYAPPHEQKHEELAGYLTGLGIALLGAHPAHAASNPAADAPSAIEDASSTEWPGTGRTPSEQRFSPLKQLTPANVGRLKLQWHADLHTFRGVESNPLFLNGVLYNVSAWSIATAYDATTGKVLWTFDPKIPVEWSRIACCGPVSRGLAAADGKIFVGALDGRLIALDAKSGATVWSTQTLDPGQPLSITGAPRVADGQVIIGNAGGDFGARGFVSAYDVKTGRQTWKFYVVPGDPAKPDGVASDSVMPMAAKTWNGEWWKVGGGGNVWDGMAHDPATHTLYIATGNGSPHPSAFRSPGGGDNLFLCSIVALDARTGQYQWHYQESAWRGMGLRLHHDAGAGRPDNRWQPAQGADARTEGRLLLRAGSHERQAAVGKELRSQHLGVACGPGNRTSGGLSGCAPVREAEAADAGLWWRP